MSARLSIFLVGLATSISLQSAQAQVVEPTLGGEVSVIQATATTLEVSFGIKGTGQGRVLAVVATPNGAPMPLAAADNTFYTANPTYGHGAPLGQGYAVYNGTGHSVVVTGLQPNTSYYITNAEYNTDGTLITYNTRSTSTVTRTAPAVALAVLAPLTRSVQVYPSPSAGQEVKVLLLGFERESLTMQLADMLGRTVLTRNLTALTARHETLLPNNLAPGSYLLMLHGNSSVVQKKIIVSN